MKFTLDTNCLIDIDEGRDEAVFVSRILDAAESNNADVAIVASSASERQKNGGFLDSIDSFRDRLQCLGFGQTNLLMPIGRWTIGFWNYGLWSSDELAAREQLIYSIMFPDSPYEWIEYASAKKTSVEDKTSTAYLRWRNQILDAQAFWAHDHYGRDVFVTSDQKFQRLKDSDAFPDAVILTPRKAAGLLPGGHGDR